MRQSAVVNNWIEEGRQEGRAEGRQEGRAEGRQEGRAEGRQEGRAELLETMLRSKFGALPPEAAARLRSLTDDQLKVLTAKLFTASTISELGL